MTGNEWLNFAGIAGAVLVLGWLIFWVYRAKLLEREERRLMIERGMTPPPILPDGWPAVRAREQELRYQERRLRIERGEDPGELNTTIPNPFNMLLPKEPRRPEGYLHRGLVALAAGLGLLAPFVVIRWSGTVVSADSADFVLFLAGIGPLVALYGAANLLYYALTKNRPDEPASPSSREPRSGS